jgi:carbonic anhydrase
MQLLAWSPARSSCIETLRISSIRQTSIACQFAVETLRVKHIIVCGHYGCGGVRAVLDGSQHGLIDHWLAPIRELFRQREEELSSLPNDEDRLDRVCELNVRTQVQSVCDSPILRDA